MFLVTLAGFVVFHVYWVVPVRDEMVLAEQDLTQLQMEINEALQIASQLREVETDVDDLTERLESLAAALPQERDVSAVPRRLQTTGGSIEPLDSCLHSAGGRSAGAARRVAHTSQTTRNVSQPRRVL